MKPGSSDRYVATMMMRRGCHLSFLFLLTEAFFLSSFKRRRATPERSSCSLVSLSSEEAETGRRRQGGSFHIERVSCKSRALDVRVFRSWSMSASEYQQKQLDENGVTLSEQEAVHALTRSIDENGRDRQIVGQPLVQIVAVCDNCKFEKQEEESFAGRTNGVVATVDTQIQKRPNNSGSSTVLPWPHAYLKNLHVLESHRRMGIASALVKAVKDYAVEQNAKAVVLDVEPENLAAVRLYESEGYEFSQDTDTHGRMVLNLN